MGTLTTIRSFTKPLENGRKNGQKGGAEKEEENTRLKSIRSAFALGKGGSQPQQANKKKEEINTGSGQSRHVKGNSQARDSAKSPSQKKGT